MNKRITFIDLIRGLCIIYVIFYHLMYDLKFFFDVNISYDTFNIFNLLRDIFVIMLVVISGISCNFSKNNIKRGLICLIIAYLLTLATFIMDNNFYIIFGILHMFGVSMIVYGILKKYFMKVKPAIGILISSVLFFVTFFISQNIIGIKNFLYFTIKPTNSVFYIFGIKTNDFVSSDYYPMFPWFFAFLVGSYIGMYIKSIKLKDYMYKNNFKILSYIGSHTMIIYLAHQPILFGVLWLIFNFK